MTDCDACLMGEEGTQRVGDWKFDYQGVVVLLRGVTISACPECQGESVDIPNLAGLHRVIAEAIAKKRAALTGPEFRFLRKHLGHSQKDLAKLIVQDNATISRWETGERSPDGSAERLVRLLVLNNVRAEGPYSEVLESIGVPDYVPEPCFIAEGGNWRACA